MATRNLLINNVTVEDITFNNEDVNRVYKNNILVWERVVTLADTLIMTPPHLRAAFAISSEWTDGTNFFVQYHLVISNPTSVSTTGWTMRMTLPDYVTLAQSGGNGWYQNLPDIGVNSFAWQSIPANALNHQTHVIFTLSAPNRDDIWLPPPFLTMPQSNTPISMMTMSLNTNISSDPRIVSNDIPQLTEESSKVLLSKLQSLANRSVNEILDEFGDTMNLTTIDGKPFTNFVPPVVAGTRPR